MLYDIDNNAQMKAVSIKIFQLMSNQEKDSFT